jgi:hypothetical protein
MKELSNTLFCTCYAEWCDLAWEQLGESRKQISCIYVRNYTCLPAELFILHLLFFVVVPCFASSKCLLRRLHDQNGGDIYLAFNAHDYIVKVSIPPPPPKRRWLRVVSVSSVSDTCQCSCCYLSLFNYILCNSFAFLVQLYLCMLFVCWSTQTAHFNGAKAIL